MLDALLWLQNVEGDTGLDLGADRRSEGRRGSQQGEVDGGGDVHTAGQ